MYMTQTSVYFSLNFTGFFFTLCSFDTSFIMNIYAQNKYTITVLSIYSYM